MPIIIDMRAILACENPHLLCLTLKIIKQNNLVKIHVLCMFIYFFYFYFLLKLKFGLQTFAKQIFSKLS